MPFLTQSAAPGKRHAFDRKRARPDDSGPGDRRRARSIERFLTQGPTTSHPKSKWPVFKAPLVAGFERPLTAPPEQSLYATERTMQETGGVLPRYSLRIDGFLSLHAPLIGGELITRPLTFTDNQLTLNASTSAAGLVRVEIQDADAQLLPGFALAPCQEVYGDDLDRTVIWAGNPDLGAIAGKPVRLRFEVKDADLYSCQFRDGSR